MLFFCKTLIEGEELFLMTKLEVLNLFIIYNKFFFFIMIQCGVCFYESMFLIFFHLIYNCSTFGYGKKV